MLPPTCDASEVEIEQPTQLASLIRVCQPGSGDDAPRYLNISTMSLSLMYDPSLGVTSYHPPAAEDDPLTTAALSAAKADARVDTHTGLFILPSHAAVTIDAAGTAQSPQVTVEPNLGHTEMALSVRTAADLFGQLPWENLGDTGTAAGKVASCALGALAMVQRNEVPSLDDAIGKAEVCVDAADEMADAWEQRQAAAAPTADDIVKGISRGAKQGSTASDDIIRAAQGTISVLVRRR